MTVETTTRKEQFTVATATADYDFTFRALTAIPTDIKCKVTVNNVDADLTYTTDYTVSINANGVGGTVTLVAPEDYNGDTLTVYRETTNTQESDYDDYNQFPADTLETDIDKRTMQAQEAAEEIARSLKVSITSSLTGLELPLPAALQFIRWNAAADGLENSIPIGAIGDPVSITIADTGNAPAITAVQNDVTNNPNGISITNTGTGTGLAVAQDGAGTAVSISQSAAAHALLISQDTVNYDPMVQITNSTTSGGGGRLLFINSTSDQDNSSQLLYVSDTSTGDSSGAVAYFYANKASGVDTQAVLSVKQDYASASGDTVQIYNDGTGRGLFIDQNGAGSSLVIDHDGTTGYGLDINVALTSASDLYAMRLVATNAGAGAILGIDLSGFAAGESLFGVPVDATDPTGGGGAATGRIAITVAGVGVKYIAYY